MYSPMPSFMRKFSLQVYYWCFICRHPARRDLLSQEGPGRIDVSRGKGKRLYIYIYYFFNDDELIAAVHDTFNLLLCDIIDFVFIIIFSSI